ncbi:hypothetical protein PUN28_005698 [Cardiocondyla obscurior]|uniref:Uncharacterized protein n=1 Tax=Cardiocondyla obscurior TaxID=286306 RepID=A0AAW2G6V2_9HYME
MSIRLCIIVKCYDIKLKNYSRRYLDDINDKMTDCMFATERDANVACRFHYHTRRHLRSARGPIKCKGFTKDTNSCSRNQSRNQLRNFFDTSVRACDGIRLQAYRRNKLTSSRNRTSLSDTSRTNFTEHVININRKKNPLIEVDYLLLSPRVMHGMIRAHMTRCVRRQSRHADAHAHISYLISRGVTQLTCIRA